MKEKSHDPLEGIKPDGTITTGASSSRLVPAFRSVLEEAVQELKRIEKESSLFVYGSVATGTAIVGQSDVDLLTIGLDEKAAKDLSAELSKRFSKLCRSVEVGAGQHSAYKGSDDESYGNKVFLRHYCVHLLGPDLRASLPDFPADIAAARGFNGDIAIFADKWRTELKDCKNFVFLGRRIARKTLLATTGLVSIHDQTWTTNRISAANRWAQVRPELKPELHTLTLWNDGKVESISAPEIQHILNGTVAKVIEDFSNQIGLWSA